MSSEDHVPMSEEVHAQRHKELHKAIDELAADFIAHNPGKYLSSTSVMQLIQWSHAQTIKPTADRR